MKKIWVCMVAAALLLASCGNDNTNETSSESSQMISGENATGVSEENSESSETEQPSSSSESADPDEQPSDPDVLFALEEGTQIDRMFLTPDGNFAAEVARDDEMVLMLLSPDGNLLKEQPVQGRTLLREPDGFSLMETGDYYTFDLEESTAEQVGSSADQNEFHYSEDGKYLQLVLEDGTILNACKTNAQSYDEIESGNVQFSCRNIGQYSCFSGFRNDGQCGCYDTESGEWQYFNVSNGFVPSGMWDGLLTGCGQWMEGGMYPQDTSLSHFDPETGELSSLALPLDVWPVIDFTDGRYYLFTVGFYDTDGELNTRLFEQFPGLDGMESQDASLLLAYDAVELQPVGYIYHSERTEYFSVLTDGENCYVWDTETTENGSRAVVRQYPLTAPDQPPEV